MTLGRYELVCELGEGGMASVFGARDTKLGRDVAVKVMFPHLARRKEAASRFKREARAAAGLDHEHILRVFDVGGGEVIDEVLVPPYIVLERIDGHSLDEFFEANTPPIAEVVAAIGVAICRALAVAHAQNIVHRDIKPANIMVTTKGRLVLADFGVARVGDGDDDSVVTRTGAILGTPAYMSPEQACAEDVDGRSDLYSLGATLYRIATGNMPYTGSAAQIMTAIIDGKRVPAQRRDPRIGRELSRVIDKLMNTDKEQRYASAQLAEVALLAIVEGGGEVDAEALLVGYVQNPAEQNALTCRRAIRENLVRARHMSLTGRGPLALALAERVLAISPDNAQAQALCDSIGENRHKRVWLAILGPMIVTAGFGLLFWGYRPGLTSTYVADAGLEDAWVPTLDSGASAWDGSASPTSPQLTVLDAGEGDHVDPLDAGMGRTPRKTSHSRGTSRARPTLALDAAPVHSLVQESADAGNRGAPASIAIAPALLRVDIRPWCDVWIDGHRRERASKTTTYRVPPGRHLIECKQEGTGMRWAQQVNLASGQERVLTGSVLGTVTVSVRLMHADEVRIGKYRIGNGESLRIPGGRYQVQIWRGGAAVAGPTYLVLRASCSLQDTPVLACQSE